MKNSSFGRSRPLTLLLVPLALIASLAMGLTFSASASAANFTPDQRKEYFDSGKYDQDLHYVGKLAQQWIIKRTAKTLPVVKACRKAGYRIGKKDPGPDPNADYRVPVAVPKSQQPIAPVVQVPNPGPGPLAEGQSNLGQPKTKSKRVKKIKKSRCAKLPKLAIAMDMDETATSSFRFGSPQPNYDDFSMYRNLVLGSQSALEPMLQLTKLAKSRGVTPFVITARYDPLQADPLVGQLIGGADLCDPSIAWAGACGIDFDTFDYRAVTMANLKAVGYTGLGGLYMRPPESSAANGTGKDVVKNSQRAEIVKRRGYDLIAMFGDQNSDLKTGFYERGFKFQSSVTPEQD